MLPSLKEKIAVHSYTLYVCNRVEAWSGQSAYLGHMIT